MALALLCASTALSNASERRRANDLGAKELARALIASRLRRHRLFVHFGLGAAASVLQALLLCAAIAQSPAPGAGHGFLIDKHINAGVTCSKCHSESPPRQVGPMTTCLACHGGSYENLAAMTTAQPNPHASHRGQVACGECHRVHVASVTMCNQCHTFDLTTP